MLIEDIEMTDPVFAEERARHRAMESIATGLSLSKNGWKWMEHTSRHPLKWTVNRLSRIVGNRLTIGIEDSGAEEGVGLVPKHRPC